MANGKVGAPKGNRNGVKSRRLFSDTLKRVLTQSPEQIEKLARQLIEWAEEGEQWAFREMLDRLEGKPHQSMDIAHTEVPAEEMDDAELLDIARRGGRRGTSPPRGTKEPTGLH